MIVLCLGRRELGKSTLGCFIARRKPIVVILDPRFMFATADPIGDLPGDNQLLWDSMQAPGESIVQPENSLDKTTEELALLIREWCQQAPASQHLAVLLDECALLELNTDAWNWVFRCSPRERITIILTAHRPKDISTTVRALADMWCVFKTTQEHDLDVIEERCGREFADRVRDLKPREFLAWDDAKSSIVVYRDPTIWYVPLRPRTVAIASTTLPDGEAIDVIKQTPLFPKN